MELNRTVFQLWTRFSESSVAVSQQSTIHSSIPSGNTARFPLSCFNLQLLRKPVFFVVVFFFKKTSCLGVQSVHIWRFSETRAGNPNSWATLCWCLFVLETKALKKTLKMCYHTSIMFLIETTHCCDSVTPHWASVCNFVLKCIPGWEITEPLLNSTSAVDHFMCGCSTAHLTIFLPSF